MNSIEILFQKPVFHALGWTLLHFIWQGALVASLFSVFAGVARKWPANVRYAAACGALLLLLAAPVITFGILFGSAVPANAIAANWTSSAACTGQTPVWKQAELSKQGRDSIELLKGPSECQPPAKATTSGSTEASRLPALVRDKFNSIAPWLVALWFVGVLCLSIRFIGGLAFTRRLKNERSNAASTAWQDKVADLCKRLRVSRPVLLCESALVQVPTVIGWLRPAILVPASALTGLTSEQLEALLAHELAHIRRYDYLVNLVQTAVETLLFYHPAVWWISAQIRIERENCCDDVAVATCGDVLTYARALADLEQIRGAAPQLALAANGGSLLNRIERLVGKTRPGRRHHVGPQLAGLLSVATVFVFLLSASGAFPPGIALGAIENKLASAAAASPIAKFLKQEDKSSSGTAAQQSTDNKETGSKPESSAPKDADKDVSVDVDVNVNLDTRDIEPQDRESSNQPAANYIEQMEAAGYKNLTIDQLIELKMQGVTPDYIKAMRDAGYDKLPVHALIAMRVQGVTPQYVREMADAGYPHLSVEELVGMRIQGVSPDYVRQMKSAGFDDLSSRALIGMRSQGVTPEYVKEMREAGFDKLSPNDLMALRVQGVDPAYVKRMREAGLDNLSARELAAFRAQGIEPEYIKEMRDSGLDKLSAHQLIGLKAQEVTPDFIRQMKAAGLTELSAERLAGLKAQGVTPEYIQQMKSIGLGEISTHELIEMKVQGVDADYVKKMRGLVSKDLSIHALIALKVQGVDAEFIDGLRRVGYSNLPPEQLVQLKVMGVTPEYVQELKSAGFTGLSVHDIAEAKAQGITPEFIRKVKEHGFKDLTIRQLIRLKMAGITELTGEVREPRPAPAPRAIVTVEPDVITDVRTVVAPQIELRVVCNVQPAAAPLCLEKAMPGANSVTPSVLPRIELDSRCIEKGAGVLRQLKTETVKSWRTVQPKVKVAQKIILSDS